MTFWGIHKRLQDKKPFVFHSPSFYKTKQNLYLLVNIGPERRFKKIGIVIEHGAC